MGDSREVGVIIIQGNILTKSTLAQDSVVDFLDGAIFSKLPLSSACSFNLFSTETDFLVNVNPSTFLLYNKYNRI